MKSKDNLSLKQDLPRERIREKGVQALNNIELIAAIIGTGSQQRTVLELSSDLLGCLQDGISSLDGITLEELTAIEGIGNGKACQILASVELGKRVYHKEQNKMTKISSPSDISDLLMAELRYKKQEHFKTLILDTKNQVLSIETITIGTLNASLVHPREVFNKAIRKSAHAVVLAHNHPSGHPQPSQEDLLLTERLVESGKIIGITVLDHVIIGDGIFYSFKEHGLL